MKLPRDLRGKDLALRLAKFGYQQTRQTGSHIRLVSTFKGYKHHLSVPAHVALKPGTLNSILSGAANYLEIEKDELIKALFEN